MSPLESMTVPAPDLSGGESVARFRCFGSDCAVLVLGDVAWRSSAGAVALARSLMLQWHRGFSRFEADSELCRLNADERARVPVSPVMARLVTTAVMAAELTGGLVDPTLVGEIEQAGYAAHFTGPGPSLRDAVRRAPARRPGAPHAIARWREVHVDHERNAVSRPPGLRFDSGGIAKGMFADLLGELFADHASAAVDCGGDLRLSGTGRAARRVEVTSPFDDGVLHSFDLRAGGVATSGIGKRSWLGAHGAPSHHLLDPATGRPAFTGVVQATALAPTAAEAEARAKAAVIAGPGDAPEWLEHGGVIVFDDASHRVVPAGGDKLGGAA